jgi:cytochrome c553
MQGQGDYGPAIAANSILVQKASLEGLLRKGGILMPAVGDNWSDVQMRALEAYLKKSVYKGASASGG